MKRFLFLILAAFLLVGPVVTPAYAIYANSDIRSPTINRVVTDLATLKATSGSSTIKAVHLMGGVTEGDGREGDLYWLAGDQSANAGVLADTQEGVFVKLTSPGDGSTGVWVRMFTGMLESEWFGAIGDWDGATGTDNSTALVAAANMSKFLGTYLHGSGRYYYTTTLDFTANSCGFIGDGAAGGGQGTELIYDAEGMTRAIQVDQGGTHTAVLLSGISGTFKIDEAITSGAKKGRVRFIDGTTIQYTLFDGTEFVATDVITGDISGATATVASVVAASFGDSLESIRFEGFTLTHAKVQAVDGFSRPLDWAQAVGIHLNGARNHSIVQDVRIQGGFLWGLYEFSNWLSSINRVNITNSKYGCTLDDECNNMGNNLLSIRRAGDIADLSGWSLRTNRSYANTVMGLDMETGNSAGAIYDQCHSITHISGDIEGGGESRRRIIIKGQEGVLDGTFDTEPDRWSRGIQIIGVRFREVLGIRLEAGARDVNLIGNTFTRTTLATGVNAITYDNASTAYKNIIIGKDNDFYGDDAIEPDIPLDLQAAASFKDESKGNFIEGIVDLANANGQPIGWLPNGVNIKEISFHIDYNATVTGLDDFDVHVGIEGNIASVLASYAINLAGGLPVLATTPFGFISSTPPDTQDFASGTVRVRPNNSTATGFIIVRVWY